MPTDPREPVSSLLKFTNNTVLLVVGPTRETFLLHRAHAHSSTFFTSAFKGAWAGDSRELSLPDDEPRLIRTYLPFLHTGKIACKDPNVDTSLEIAEHADETAMLAGLYVLGEKRHDFVFKNAVIDAIIALSNYYYLNEGIEDRTNIGLTGSGVNTVYQGSYPGSHVRRLMVDFHVRFGTREWMMEEDVVHIDFSTDLCAALLEVLRGGRGGALGSNCSYHEHADV